MPQGAGPGQHKVPGGKREQQSEVERLRQIVESMRIERLEAMRSEARFLVDALPRLRREQADLVAPLALVRAKAQHLGAQWAEAAGIDATLVLLRSQQHELTAAVLEVDRLTAAVGQLRIEHVELASRLVETRGAALLQEAGIYECRHPLDDSIAHKANLAGLQALIKDALQAGTAIHSAAIWSVNRSSAQAKMPPLRGRRCRREAPGVAPNGWKLPEQSGYDWHTGKIGDNMIGNCCVRLPLSSCGNALPRQASCRSVPAAGI